MSDTAKYTVTEHWTATSISYSVRLPDVQQMPGAATRYLETAAGRRRTFRSRLAAQAVADSLNPMLERALAKQEPNGRQDAPSDPAVTEYNRNAAEPWRLIENRSAPTELTLAQKVIAAVNHWGSPYGAMIHGENGTDMDVEFPTMLQAASFVKAYDLEDVAKVATLDPRHFNQPVLITFTLAAYARANGIEV